MRKLLDIIDKNLIANCPVTREDVMAAEDIFGPNLGSLKGKTVRRPPLPIEQMVTAVPQDILSKHNRVVIAADIVYVNEVPLLLSISHHLKFGTVTHLKSRSVKQIAAAIRQTRDLYAARGFQVVECRGDHEFEAARSHLGRLGILLNAATRDAHVPEIERYNRTVKDRVRSAFHMLPFKRMPRIMIIELVKAMFFWLNAVPANDGVSDTISPRTLLTGQKIDYNRHCRLGFGTYIQTHEEHDNSMAPRTTGAIALRPTGNAEGGYYFMSLTTGRKLSRDRWTEMPMPNEVITQVESLAGDDGGVDSFNFFWGDHSTNVDNPQTEDGFLPAPTGVGYRSQHNHINPTAPAPPPNPFAALAYNDDDDAEPEPVHPDEALAVGLDI